MSEIPSDVLTGVIGSIGTVLVMVLAHISKVIPFKISFVGEAKKVEYISRDDLEKNCKARQESLDKKLEKIFDLIQQVNLKIDGINATVISHRIELGERLARVEELKG